MPRKIAAYFNVVKTQWLVVFFIFSTQLAVAYTSYPVDVHCPIDSTEFTIFETRSYYTSGSLTDFQKVGSMGAYYKNMVHSCPHCHYAGYARDFDTTFSDQERSTLLKLLEPYKHYKMTDLQENEVAIAIKKRGGADHKELAHLYLVSSYMIKEQGWQRGKRKALQRSAILHIEKAIELREYPDSNMYATMTYLQGELYRRVGEFKTAIRLFDAAIADPSKSPSIEALARKQKALARRRSANNAI
jgi:tetratricopeptide (TPR) repeat protein